MFPSVLYVLLPLSLPFSSSSLSLSTFLITFNNPSLLADFHLLQELLHIDVLSLDGCQDLISILLEGYLDTSVESVATVGLYKSSGVYVRLFGMLFDGDEELRRYLLHPESGCGDVLKEVSHA